MKILVICTGNSCRSQMAEGFLKSIATNHEVYSAGTHPASKVSHIAIQVMNEAGIDISSHHPKHISIFEQTQFDYVITVCDSANRECPIFPGEAANRLHIGFDDPANAHGTQDEIINEYRRIRDEIRLAFQDFYEKNLDIN
ncbi:MAG: arsenate reductase [Ignavibacteria bacterium]|nr:arsenate reductase [Ignavibacteria bacterium]